MRLFLDANILFTAAHNPHGKAALVIEIGQSGIWQLATSAYAAEEARRNIARNFPPALIDWKRFWRVSDGLLRCPELQDRKAWQKRMCPFLRGIGLSRRCVVDR